MSDEILCPGIREKHPDEADNYGVGFQRRLLSGEALASVFSVAALPIDSFLVITGQVVNSSSPFTDPTGCVLLQGTAVVMNIAGGVPGMLYYITVEAITTTGRKLAAVARLLISAGIPNALTTTTSTTTSTTTTTTAAP